MASLLPTWEWIAPPTPKTPQSRRVSILSDGSKTFIEDDEPLHDITSEPEVVQIDSLRRERTAAVECVDLTIEGDASIHHKVLENGEISLTHLIFNDFPISKGHLIEIKKLPILHRLSPKGTSDLSAKFVLVEAIIKVADQEPFLRGIPFIRTRDLDNKLPKKVNEVCMVSHSSPPSHVANQQPTFIDVPQAAIINRRRLIVTNTFWPEHNPAQRSFLHIADELEKKRMRQQFGALVCRWRYELYPLEANSKITSSMKMEEVIRRLRADEVPKPKYRACDASLLQLWRPYTVKGGSHIPEPEKSRRPGIASRQRSRGQKYTLFDSFCGAGGVSRGAQMAGLHPQVAIDMNEDACKTYALNFPAAELFRQPISDFVQTPALRDNTAIDILHLSPPCQYFSPAHTTAAAHDEANIDALKCCQVLVQLCRPRIVTLEQTFGITHDRHSEFWQSLLNDFTSLGFSLRWQVVSLEGWGAAQTRKRLILIAAAPGEALPPLPLSAHNRHGTAGLRKYETIDLALKRVESIQPGDDPLHDLSAVAYHDPPKPPYNASELSGTITTSGGDRQWHPSGHRNLTIREIACIQGFPLNHKFLGTKSSIYRQIGNAFPPRTVKHLFQHLEKWLLRRDNMSPWRPEGIAVDVEDVRRGLQLLTPALTPTKSEVPDSKVRDSTPTPIRTRMIGSAKRMRQQDPDDTPTKRLRAPRQSIEKNSETTATLMPESGVATTSPSAPTIIDLT